MSSVQNAAAVPGETQVHLRAGHVMPIWAGHPWVYAQAIARVVPAEPAVGAVARVFDPQGNSLGRGFWSPRSAIPVRIVSRDDSEQLQDSSWIANRLLAAMARRKLMGLPSEATTGFRLMHAEGDDVPGLIVDRFGCDTAGLGGVAVMQLGTAGLASRRAQVIAALREVLAPSAILDRTTPQVAKTEGFEPGDPMAHAEGLDALRFVERGIRYELPLDLAQKTGYYFDQRMLRARVETLAKGRRVLDAYCYVGAIGLSAARGGAASVVAIDESLRAVEVGGAIAKANGLAVTFRRGEVKRELPSLAAAGEKFDLVVLDPPKLAPSRADHDAALKHQTKLVELAVSIMAPSGLLVASSCSQSLGMHDLIRAIAVGGRRMDRMPRVLERLGQGPDHPVLAAFPEGFYLSTVIAEVA